MSYSLTFFKVTEGVYRSQRVWIQPIGDGIRLMRGRYVTLRLVDSQVWLMMKSVINCLCMTVVQLINVMDMLRA